MSLIVKTVTRLTFGLILLFGVYIAFHGHHSSGGGFAGGVIIALAFAHLTLAFGKKVSLKKLSVSGASFVMGLGVVIFLFVAVLGFIGGCFFFNFLGIGNPFDLFSAGTIPVYNVAAISLNVGAGLFAVFLALQGVSKEDKE